MTNTDCNKPIRPPPSGQQHNASASTKPMSTKRQSTLDEAKAWAESKGLQPPR